MTTASAGPAKFTRFIFAAVMVMSAGLAAFGTTHAHADSYSPPHVARQAEPFWKKIYVRAGVGYTWFGKFKGNQDSYLEKAPKAALLYTAGVGYRFTDAIRTDLNFYYGNLRYKASINDMESGDIRNLTQTIRTIGAMLNGYYDFRFHKILMPYLTVGAGIGRNEASALNNNSPTGVISRKSKSKTDFIWGAGTGINVRFSEHYTIDIGYRYLYFGRISVKDYSVRRKGGMAQRISEHQGLFSLIYSF